MHICRQGRLQKESRKCYAGNQAIITPSSTQTVDRTSSIRKYYLGKGNNEGLVRRVMENRSTWIESDDSTSSFLNMKWQQDQKGMKY